MSHRLARLVMFGTAVLVSACVAPEPGDSTGQDSSPVESPALDGFCPPYNVQVGVLHIVSAGGCNRPALLNLHGGGWTTGSAADMDSPFGAAEVASGIVYATLEYTDGAAMSQITGEVDLAFNYLRGNADLYGVDPSRVGVLGFSAGAHLALTEAMTNHAVRWVGSLSGPTDLAGVFDNLWNEAQNPQLQAAAVPILEGMAQVLGGTPTTDPQVYAQYSPIDNYPGLIGSGAITAFYLADAVDDGIVPLSQVNTFVAALQSIGGSVFLRTIGPNVGNHFASIAYYQEAIANFLNAGASSFHAAPPPPPATISAGEAAGLVDQAFAATTQCRATGADIAGWSSLFYGKPDTQPEIDGLMAQIETALHTAEIVDAAIPQLVDTVYLQIDNQHATAGEITAATPLFQNLSALQCGSAFDQLAASLLAGPRSSSAAPTEIVYRSYLASQGDHLYSTDPDEGPSAGYVNEGPAFDMFPSNGPGLVPIYRCWYPSSSGTDHFMTRDPNCEGQHVDGRIGYLEPSGNQPVLRCLDHATGKHLITTGLAECVASGFDFEQNLGFTECASCGGTGGGGSGGGTGGTGGGGSGGGAGGSAAGVGGGSGGSDAGSGSDDELSTHAGCAAGGGGGSAALIAIVLGASLSRRRRRR